MQPLLKKLETKRPFLIKMIVEIQWKQDIREIMKQVYLFELDSVKKRDEQIITAQKALFDEIVCNGNCVVMSLNQLVDSRMILSMLNSEKYSSVLNFLFQYGYLKYSRYGDYRTPSQYIQRSIEDRRDFIYSALPVKSTQYRLCEMIKNALKNDDVSEIAESIEKQKKAAETLDLFDECSDGKNRHADITKEEAIKSLEYICSFVKLTIDISISNDSFVPAIEYTEEYRPFSFMDFMDLAVKFDCRIEGYAQASAILKAVKQYLEANNRALQSRSEWIKAINRMKDPDNPIHYRLSECIVGLCYNYTVEYSIHNVSKHYETSSLFDQEHASFKNDFLNRLELEWQDGADSGKYYLLEETNHFEWFEETDGLPDWGLALRVLEKKKNDAPGKDDNDVALYENNYYENRRKEKRKNYGNLFILLFAAVVSIGLIFGYSNLEDIIVEHSDGYVARILENDILRSFVVFILAGVIGAAVENAFHISSLLDIMREIVSSVSDVFQLVILKPVAYVNKKEVKHLRFEKPSRKRSRARLNQLRISEYCRLWEKRPDSFTPSSEISLVNPNEDMDIILDYEMKHHVKLGVVYKTPYNIHVVDLVRKDTEDGETYYSYERILPAVEKGAAVAVVKLGEQFVLLSQFRHAIRRNQYGFVRGFGEQGLSAEENVKKEIAEEIGANVKMQPVYLGEVVADSGMLANHVSVYYAEVSSVSKMDGYEGINGILLLDESELEEYIYTGKIDDGFTLSAFALYKAHKSAIEHSEI